MFLLGIKLDEIVVSHVFYKLKLRENIIVVSNVDSEYNSLSKTIVSILDHNLWMIGKADQWFQHHLQSLGLFRFQFSVQFFDRNLDTNKA